MNVSTRTTTLITGATSGIGYELARLFAADGSDLIILAREEERLAAVAAELGTEFGVNVRVIAADLFEPDAAQKVYDAVTGAGIVVDTLVNDAGQGEHGAFFATDLGRQLDVVQLNIDALITLTHLFGNDMVERGGGRILQLGSLVSKMPSPFLAVYAATKAFVLSFSEALANELKDTGVTVTVLMPGATDTDFFHKAGSTQSKVYAEGSLADPAQVAKDGYEAMKRGDTTVISGLKNKVQGAMADLLPNNAVASTGRAQNAEVAPEQGQRTEATHEASRLERRTLDRH